MRHISQRLNIMVGKRALQLRGRGGSTSDVAELEWRIHRALAELRRSRPRLVEFAPRQALQRTIESPIFGDGRRRDFHESARLAGVVTVR